MGEKTGISWTNHTWNPWYGCHKVSQGCKHCYMFREQKQYGRDPNVVVRSKTTFNAPLRWRDPALVFTCSWSDFFIEEADEWRDEAWAIIRKTPHLTYQILTKRPLLIKSRLPSDWGMYGYPNVWLGVSIEDQQTTSRIPILLANPAAVHFISAEPLLEKVDLENVFLWDANNVDGKRAYLNSLTGFGYRVPSAKDDLGIFTSHLDWVICGGESGPEARMLHRDWARSIRDQCIRADVPFFFKQWSGLHPAQECELDGVHWRQFPDVYVNGLTATKLL